MKEKSYKSQIALGIAGVVLLVVGFSSTAVISTGHAGVVTQMGAVKGEPMQEGFHFKLPFVQDVIEVETRVQKEQSKQTAASRDLQNVTTEIAVNFSLDEHGVNKLYQEVGLDYRNRIVQPAIGEALKAVTAQYTAEELISKRPEVSSKVKDVLSKKLDRYHMKLEDINITKFEFSESFNEAIESKQKAEQLALKAKRDLERIEIEAKQKVTQAQAEAESLKLKKQEVTPQLVDLKKLEVQEKSLDIQSEAIKKWNGQMPNVTGGATPFFNVNPNQ